MKKIFKFFLAAISLFTVTSCTNGKEMIDYAHNGSAPMVQEYAGHDFWEDGVGQVSLKTPIDGDTAHFTQPGSSKPHSLIKIRFYGINTPESTGKIEPYGKQASNFTKEKLKAAAENGTIVLSSPSDNYEKPKQDNNDRFLGLVWIHETKKDAPINELVLLNLWIVQEGFAWVSNVGDVPRLADVFLQADQQARDNKLHIYSGEEDPLFPKNTHRQTTLLEIKRETEKYLLDSSYIPQFDGEDIPEGGINVTVSGAVAGFSDKILYLQDFYTKEDGAKYDEGEWAGVNIFCGFKSIPTRFKKINSYIQVFGVATFSENFGFQISGVEGKFSRLDKPAPFAQYILAPEENVAEHSIEKIKYTAAELDAAVKANDFRALGALTELSETVICSDAYFKSNSEITLSFKDPKQTSEYKFGCYITFSLVGDPDKPNEVWTKPSDFIGKAFHVEGVFTYHQDIQTKEFKYQFRPSSKDEIFWVKPEVTE